MVEAYFSFYPALAVGGYELVRRNERGRKKGLYLEPRQQRRPPDSSSGAGAKVSKYGKVFNLINVLKNPGIFLEFGFTETNSSAVMAFANKYGFINAASYPSEAGADYSFVSDWYPEIRSMKSAITAWLAGEHEAVDEQIMNRKLEECVAMLTRNGNSGEIEILLLPRTLLDALWFQFFEAVGRNAQTRKCEWCPTWFEFGSGTSKRSNARFCSKKCEDDSYNQKRRKTNK